MSCFCARRDPITLQLERLWNQNTAVVRHQRILLMSDKQLKWTTLVKRTIKVQRWENFRYDDCVSLQVNRIDPTPADTAKKKSCFQIATFVLDVVLNDSKQFSYQYSSCMCVGWWMELLTVANSLSGADGRHAWSCRLCFWTRFNITSAAESSN